MVGRQRNAVLVEEDLGKITFRNLIFFLQIEEVFFFFLIEIFVLFPKPLDSLR